MPDYSYLKGTGVAIITPFNVDKTIDYNALSKCIEHCINGGVESIISMGTTGESVTLSLEERKQVIRFTADQVNNRVTMIAGIGGNNTNEVCHEIESLDTNKIKAVLTNSPAYNKPSQEGIFQHYMQIQKVSSLPIIIYNVPGRTASNILPETILRLANASEKFAGVKEASGDLTQANKILKDRPNHFLVLSGDDPTALGHMGIGGDGVISVIANIFPKQFSDLIRYAASNNFAEAQLLNNLLFDLHKWLYIEGNPVGIKAAASYMGLCSNEFRLPLVPMSETNYNHLIREVNKIV